MSKKKVKFSRMNWDAEFYSDLQTGRGFIITEPSEITVEGVKKKALYGAQSPLYGTSYEDEQAFIERYRCECGAFKSRQFEGETCPICGTKVECRDSDINVTGWISLGDYKIISPYYYNLFLSALGKSDFPEIIQCRRKVGIDGIIENVVSDSNSSTPYAGVGIDGFYEKYEEILEFFKNGSRKKKAKDIDLLLKQKKCAFISHIPIASTMLRPQSITSDTYYFNTIDKVVNTIFSLSNKLKSLEDVEVPRVLYRLQTKVNMMWETYFDLLKSKDGWIRGEMLGGRLNYTSRNVIVPDPSLKDNEIDISYNTFLRLFEYKIIYYLMKIDNLSLSDAYDTWRKGTVFNERLYNIMKQIVANEDTRCIINRNPTLNYYSMLLMKIRNIEKDGNSYSMSIPLSVLPGLNADFDGDILNIIGIMDDSMAYMFRKFDPIKRMIISRDTGELNRLFTIDKGQRIDLFYFSTIGAKENDQPETFPVKDNKTGEIIYVPESEISKYKSGKLSINDYDVEALTTVAI